MLDDRPSTLLHHSVLFLCVLRPDLEHSSGLIPIRPVQEVAEKKQSDKRSAEKEYMEKLDLKECASTDDLHSFEETPQDTLEDTVSCMGCMCYTLCHACCALCFLAKTVSTSH